jgi:hypothetical protein
MPAINENLNEEKERSRRLREVRRRLEGRLEEGEYEIEIIEEGNNQEGSGKKAKSQENNREAENKNENSPGEKKKKDESREENDNQDEGGKMAGGPGKDGEEENKKQEPGEDQTAPPGHKMPTEKSVPAQEPKETEAKGAKEGEGGEEGSEKGIARKLKANIAKARQLAGAVGEAAGEIKKAAKDILNLRKLKKEKERLDTALKVVKGVKTDALLLMKFDGIIDLLEAVDGGTIISLILAPIKIVIFLIKLKNIVGGLASGHIIIVKIKVKVRLIYIIATIADLIPFISALPWAFVADIMANFIYNKAVNDLEKQIKDIDERIKKSTALLGAGKAALRGRFK